MPATLLLVRHAEAEHNAAFHRGEGEASFQDPKYEDAPLTEQGRTQARDLAKTLESYRILDIWSSPLTRCIETAEEIFEETSATNLYLHDALIERQEGATVCSRRKPRTELEEKFPCWDCRFLPDTMASWTDCEPAETVQHRLSMLLLHLRFLYRDAPEGSHVIVVSHGQALQTVTGKSLKNAEVVVF